MNTTDDTESRNLPSDSRCEKFIQMDDLIVSEMKELIGDSEIPGMSFKN